MKERKDVNFISDTTTSATPGSCQLRSKRAKLSTPSNTTSGNGDENCNGMMDRQNVPPEYDGMDTKTKHEEPDYHHDDDDDDDGDGDDGRKTVSGGRNGNLFSVLGVVEGEGEKVRYKECRKNHAANIGGYAVDGCREFMPAGKEGTKAAFACAACTCHRNFHRREVHRDFCCCDCSSISATPI
ncbi:hypothetical protein NMG60_11031114 [Bertholletia excelsa]